MLLASLALAFLVSSQAQPKGLKETKEEVARKKKKKSPRCRTTSA